MFWLDGRVDLANLAMVLLLASAVASLWLPVTASCALSTLSVLGFNWRFVPPTHSLSVDLSQHALLLGAMLIVAWMIAGVMGRQRLLGSLALQQGQHIQQLHRFSETLRDGQEPAEQAKLLLIALKALLERTPRMLVLRHAVSATDDDASAIVFGEPSPHERSGLWQCLRQAVAFGPGTGRHSELPEWYFPLRGRQGALGAAMVTLSPEKLADDGLRAQAQALCDQVGLSLERMQANQQAEAAREEVQLQKVRNAMLAAISHDFRTPLASILGAASALQEQADRLSITQRERLQTSIVDEVRHLSRLTDNTLQLARLDAPGVALALDWESPQELAGTVLARFRERDRGVPVRLRVEPGTPPLVRCDALLVSQLLENLIENALKYASSAPVEVLVRHQPSHIVFAVRDRGPGVARDARERIFEVFQRGKRMPGADQSRSRGTGVGLAVCRAIAQAHGGSLRLRARSHGGSSFECWLPQALVPELPEEPVIGAS